MMSGLALLVLYAIAFPFAIKLADWTARKFDDR
jgi:hypothetical protein